MKKEEKCKCHCHNNHEGMHPSNPKAKAYCKCLPNCKHCNPDAWIYTTYDDPEMQPMTNHQQLIQRFRERFVGVDDDGLDKFSNLYEVEAHLIEEVERAEKEAVNKAFDWIWPRWNLDFSNIDRAKKDFINSLKQK